MTPISSTFTTSSSELAVTDLSVLLKVLEGTVIATGDHFFQLLVQNLSEATGEPNAFVAVFTKNKTRVKTLAYWSEGQLIDNDEWDLQGSPCKDVIHGGLCHHPSGLGEKFPIWDYLESYLGVPLKDVDGEVLGHVAIYSKKQMPPTSQLFYIFKIFAARAASELSRIRAIKMLNEAEKQFRDLFDEAPIAYIHQELNSRFIRANKTALSLLGITAEEVTDCYCHTFTSSAPDAHLRMQEIFEHSIVHGTELDGVEFELFRKDNRKSIWVKFWTKPDQSGTFTRSMFIDITEHVLLEQEKAKLQAQNLYLQKALKTDHHASEIIGASVNIKSLLSSVNRVAKTDASVLIQGESGTGKELIARAIHSNSHRHEMPLIKVNCAALPAGLIESELFGHEKGAFSGAIAQRIGRFELAHGGTIFLDEIGEIPLDIQVKLLRVLQEQEFERVGGQTPIRVDVRVIAATNRNLLQEIENKAFREDLYYRLNVFPLTTPPLRERVEDIPLLVYFLIDKFSKRMGKKVEGISTKSLQRLKSYQWPGNIRELENVIERTIILADSAIIEVDPELLLVSSKLASEISQSNNSLVSVERQHILAVLIKTNWVIEGPNGAARILDLHPSTLRYRMGKLSIVKTT